MCANRCDDGVVVSGVSYLLLTMRWYSISNNPSAPAEELGLVVVLIVATSLLKKGLFNA